MADPFDKYILAGLSGLKVEAESHDLGDGIFIRATFAHLIGTYMVAFAPAPPGKAHPAPWKAARSGYDVDITAELFIPKGALGLDTNGRFDLVQLIVALLRPYVAPSVSAPILSNIPFEDAKTAPDNKAFLWPYESRGFEFPIDQTGNFPQGPLQWVIENWKDAFNLTRSSAEFRTALFALDQMQFVKDRALVLISFWSALEGLFLDTTTELRFRLALYIASYLEEPGDTRIAKHKEILKLYDHRSKAAHGKPKNDAKALFDSFNLLRDIIIRIINAKRTPSKGELESKLLGASAK
jgi:hypothetical protein